LLPVDIVRNGLIDPRVAPIAISEKAYQQENCPLQRAATPITPEAAAFAAMCQPWSRVVTRAR
jgi:hypothetical protein